MSRSGQQISLQITTRCSLKASLSLLLLPTSTALIASLRPPQPVAMTVLQKRKIDAI